MKDRAVIAFLVFSPILFATLNPSRPGWAQAAPESLAAGAAKTWPSQPPAGIPFQASSELTGIEFTGRHAQYGHADTWYPSWAANGNLYSPKRSGSPKSGCAGVWLV